MEVRTLPSPLADQTISRIVAELGNNVNMRSSALLEKRFTISMRGDVLCKHIYFWQLYWCLMEMLVTRYIKLWDLKIFWKSSN